VSYVLVINAGSSSLKYQLFDFPAEAVLCRGQIERIGTETALIRHQVQTGTTEREAAIRDHAEGFGAMLVLLTDPAIGVIDSPEAIGLVGHRVVHGGEQFAEATRIGPAVMQTIEALFPLAPLHNPINHVCIELAQRTFPRATQVAVFDTAFHQTMPARAFRYAIPEELYRQEGIRAYGFHGTSHQYVSERAMAFLQNPQARLISIHLGNGSSITAIRAGQSQDTSMGFGPLSGLVMGTRSGDIDPSVLLHLLGRGYSPDQLSHLLNKQSGMQGLVGMSDMRDIRKAAAEGDAAATLAYELYAYRVKKYIGAYIAALNGADALIFTGGIGENDATMRQLICSELDYLGITLDAEANQSPSRELRAIQSADSRVAILVIPTNEELAIARQAAALQVRL
jgi:acetate kinase